MDKTTENEAGKIRTGEVRGSEVRANEVRKGEVRGSRNERDSGEKLSALFEEGRNRLKNAEIPDWDYDSRELLLWICNLTRMELLMEPDRLVDRETAARYREYIQKRESHIPLQYLMGECEFMGLPFFVNENVLIPRQDTEVLIEWILEREKDNVCFVIPEKIEKDNPDRAEDNSDREKDSRKVKKEHTYKLLDVCTGSGCIAVSLAAFLYNRQNPSITEKSIKKAIHIDALDISEPALIVAEKNAERNRASQQPAIRFFQSNMFQNVEEQYDVIVSNPPYIPSAVVDGLMEEVKDHEPRLALDGTEDGLFFYRILAKESKNYLKPGGRLYLEIGHDQGVSVPRLLTEAGFIQIEVKKDLAGNDRAVAAVFP